MNERRLKLVLHHIGCQTFPDTIDPWAPVKEKLIKEKHLEEQGDLLMLHRPVRTRQIGFTAGISLIVLLILAFLLFTPSGKAFAQAVFHLFHPTGSEQLPSPSSAEMATPTYVPTFNVTLTAIEPTKVLPMATDPNMSAVAACASDPYGYACKIAWAEKIAGFDAKEFPSAPEGFFFKEVSQVEPGVIWLEYDVIGGGGYLFFSQGLGSDFPAFTGAVEESAIEEVRVGPYLGEYVYGDYVIGGQYTKYTWLACCRTRLRWTEGDRWYEIDKEAAMPQTDYMTKEVMIQMAEQLVFKPEIVKTPILDHLASLSEVAGVVPFKILAPTLLPPEFDFFYASYDPEITEVKLFYAIPGREGEASITINEIPLENYTPLPADVEEMKGAGIVSIHGNQGKYLSQSAYSHLLTWQADGKNITLLVYSNEILYGGSFTKDQILEIANSMR